MTSQPYPPLELANRVGSIAGQPDPFAYYDSLGAAARRDLEAMLPPSWTWGGKRVLDFGCGAGRTLRHWLPEAATADLAGCDIDVESVAWLQANLSPPFTVFMNGPEPPLPVDDGAFDLVYAVSVFTHLTDTWSAWLTELHRVLDRGGLLVLTFMGPGIGEVISGEPWDDEQTGMFAIRAGQSWDFGGPMVLHSEWWIREHWGRAFDVTSLMSEGFSSVGGPSQGVVALRRRDVAVTPSALEWLDPEEPREAPALARNLAYVQREVAHQRAAASDADRRAAAAERELERVLNAHETIVGSRSWRLTRPLRRAASFVRSRERA